MITGAGGGAITTWAGGTTGILNGIGGGGYAARIGAAGSILYS